MRAVNDVIRTGPAVSWIVVRAALVAVVAAGAVLLCPLVGWQWVAVVLALVAVVIPQTFAAWGSMGCIVIGLLTSEPDLGRAMVAVLVVHLVHVLTSFTLMTPPGTRILISALRPTAVRLLLIQAVAQPLTVLVMLGSGADRATVPWTIVAGACAVIAVAVLLVVGVNRRTR